LLPFSLRSDSTFFAGAKHVRRQPDPITGEPGAHPIGTEIGATGGALAGAAIGALGGPVGMTAGANWRA